MHTYVEFVNAQNGYALAEIIADDATMIATQDPVRVGKEGNTVMTTGARRQNKATSPQQLVLRGRR